MSSLELRKPAALILSGDGINGEVEVAQAFALAGFQSEIRNVNDLLEEQFSFEQLTKQYSVFVLPSGFSFGDDLASGKILALKIQYGLGWDLTQFAARGGLVLGIANGFQTLIRLGVFGKDISITRNSSGQFSNEWVRVTPSRSKCIWLKGLGTMELPSKHADGRIVIGSSRKAEVLSKLERHGMMCLKYEENRVGSDVSLAGLCDPSGRIFGLMPQPECFIRWTSYPDWTSSPGRAIAPGQGLSIFENAFHEITRY